MSAGFARLALAGTCLVTVLAISSAARAGFDWTPPPSAPVPAAATPPAMDVTQSPLAEAAARRGLPFRSRDKMGDARISRAIPRGPAAQRAAPAATRSGGQRAGRRAHAFSSWRRGFRLPRERAAGRNGARRLPQSPLLNDNFA